MYASTSLAHGKLYLALQDDTYHFNCLGGARAIDCTSNAVIEIFYGASLDVVVAYGNNRRLRSRPKIDMLAPCQATASGRAL
jgi:hypothetical protein